MKRNKKLITLILLSLLCLGLAVTGSLAAFTKTNYIKRVVSTKAGSSEMCFSSNYLLPLKADSTPETRQLHLEQTLSLGITVCNYPQSDMTRFSSSDILFQLKVELLKADGTPITEGASIPELKIDGTALSKYTPTDIPLTGGHPSMKQFTFTYSGDINDLKNYRLRVQAEPSAKEVSTLAADFLFSEAQAADINWKGRFYPVDIKGKATPQEMDAFTYEIYGSAVGTLQLTFSSKLEIGKYSVAQLTKPVISQSGGMTSVTFEVGGEGQPTSYLLQFYRTEPISEEEETWVTIENYIKQPTLVTESTS